MLGRFCCFRKHPNVNKIIRFLFVFFAGVLVANAAPMTNADVIKLAKAGLDESIIITAIQNSEPKFDVSSQGLIDLSAAKVPQGVISALIKKSAGGGSTVTGESSPPADAMKPSDVYLVDGTQTSIMKYLTPQMRTAARAFGFGGVASYSVLRGPAAALRLKNPAPSFLVQVPEQAQTDSYFTLASFAVRGNNSREVMIGGGYMSYSSGIHPDRVIAVKAEKSADQLKVQKGFILYKVTPEKPLAQGEYAVIVYAGELQSLVGSWFTGTGNAYYDFGVDP